MRTCHATECGAAVPAGEFMCPSHWRMVPIVAKRRMWEASRSGYYDDWRPTPAYCQAARDAIMIVAYAEGREPDTMIYDIYERAAS